MSSVSSTGAVGNIPLETVIQSTDFGHSRYRFNSFQDEQSLKCKYSTWEVLWGGISLQVMMS